ncbi:diacylglycerol/lipid kinase family protein [Aestuariimicrobium ganziense]|uniref:diacylglycerol/lipid kinase family protein n=1 Tax=Aestuariimicrobium ganziense TaxID=2773677 RepID=UPI00194206F9|nr:diacylglycerol kinase family protein [Aestuariimicrobium ganziense]
MGKRISIIYNPTKIDDLDLRVGIASRLAGEHGYETPDWIPSTEDDPGFGQGKQALESGADLICAMGGDGTVRLVAQALRGSGVPFGVIAEGTGNLLARNLDLPLNDFEDALEIAMTGDDRPIDLGLVWFDDQDERVFLVIAGVGTDADTMANTHDNLKKMMGWLAYVESGSRAMLSRGFRARVDNGDLPGPDGRAHHARSYMVCNCGILTGGVVLVPEAEPDDGQLDTLVLAPKGPFGWGGVLLDIATHHRRGSKRMRHWTTHQATAEFNRPVEGQLDGDAVGEVRRMRTDIDPGSLVVRVAKND